MSNLTQQPLDPDAFASLTFDGENVTVAEPMAADIAASPDLDPLFLQETIRWWMQSSVQAKLNRNFRRFALAHGWVDPITYYRENNHRVARSEKNLERKKALRKAAEESAFYPIENEETEETI